MPTMYFNRRQSTMEFLVCFFRAIAHDAGSGRASNCRACSAIHRQPGVARFDGFEICGSTNSTARSTCIVTVPGTQHLSSC